MSYPIIFFANILALIAYSCLQRPQKLGNFFLVQTPICVNLMLYLSKNTKHDLLPSGLIENLFFSPVDPGLYELCNTFKIDFFKEQLQATASEVTHSRYNK